MLVQVAHIIQGDHLSGKPGNVRDFTENQGIVREKISDVKLEFFSKSKLESKKID